MQKRLLLSSFFLFLFSWLSASHYMGADITYQCINGCTYRIFHYTYYDCDGAATSPLPGPPPVPSITLTGSPAGCTPSPINSTSGGWVFISYQEVTPVCPTAVTKCTNASAAINGVLGGGFYQDFNLCNSNCNTYVISWSTCCRNYAITSGAGGQSISLNSVVIDLTVQPCNSSPVFNAPPVPYICAGQQFTFNQGAYDPDGDSLSYTLGPCVNTGATPVTYSPGYSATNPLGATWQVSVNPVTGDVTFTPNPTGAIVVAVMCIYVTEWRNGVQIGQIVRDMQITVLNCNIVPPQTGPIQNLTINGVSAQPLSFSTLRACPDVPVCFDIPVLAPNPQPNPPLDYTVLWNQSIPNASFTNLNNPAQQNVLTGTTAAPPIVHFCFTPPSAGTYSFVLTVKDSNCPIQGLLQYTITIYVQNAATNASAAVDYVGCNDMEFTAYPSPQAQGPFQFNWLGSGSLSSSDSNFVHSYPSGGVHTWQLSIQDTFGCTAVLSGVVNVPSVVTADAGPDYVICSGFANQIGSPPLTGQTYNWTPNLPGLSSTTIANPILNYVNLTGAPVQLTLQQQAIAGQCTTYDQVTATILPAPAADILPQNPTICVGDSIQLTAVGGTAYIWSTGDTATTIWVKPSVTTTYSLVAFAGGCASPPVTRTVNVTPGPIGNISGTFSVCQNSNTTLTASGGATYEWYNGSTNTSINLPNLQSNTPVWMIPSVGQCKGDTVFGVITVHPNPVANFTHTKVCEETATPFQDLSIISTGSIIGWNWDFADPGSNMDNAVDANPTYTYTNPGTFGATLTVTSENGCTNAITLPVTVAAAPDINFTFANVCYGATASFTNLTSIDAGNTVMAYTWDFGDLNSQPTASNAPVFHYYNQYGTYNVNLAAVSDNGCVSDFTKTIFIHPKPDANFVTSPVCRVDSMKFWLTSTVVGNLDDVVSVSWDFGDPASGPANFSTLNDPKHIYPAFGTYYTTLMVETNNGCRDTVTYPILIHPQPDANFTLDKTCANEIAEFSDLSTITPVGNVVGWNWTVATPTGALTSTAQNPRFDIGVVGAGTYNVTLIANSTENCKDTITYAIVINPVPAPDFNYTQVCFGDTTKFTNLTTISSGSMAEYDWVLDDNPLVSSNLNNPAYVYPSPGVHIVQVTAKSDSGCVHTIKKPIIVDALPGIPNISNDTICFGESAVLSLSPENPSDGVKWYEYPNASNHFHTGNSYVTPVLATPKTYYVQLTTVKGCKSGYIPVSASMFSAEQIELLASADVIELPAAPITFGYNTTIPLTAWEWNFGDGNTSILPNPVHEFANPDLYEVVLNSTDENGCKYENKKVIEVKRVVTVTPPTAFSPNGDGYNDYYYVGYYNVRSFNIQIYDRWGVSVFESDSPDFKWDGRDKSGKELPEGVYVFVIKAVSFDNNKINKSGTITLAR